MNKRAEIIAKARERFIPSRTKNITEALRLYLEEAKENSGCREEKPIPLVITRRTRPKNFIDIMGRPECPKCGKTLGLRIIRKKKGPGNLRGYKSCWECLACGYEEYSQKGIFEWLAQAKLAEKEKRDWLST